MGQNFGDKEKVLRKFQKLTLILNISDYRSFNIDLTTGCFITMSKLLKTRLD